MRTSAVKRQPDDGATHGVRPFNERWVYATAYNQGTLADLISEIVRNAFLHGVASRVGIELKSDHDPRKMELRFYDNGRGLSARAAYAGDVLVRPSPQDCFRSIGNSSHVGGGGGGARTTALTFCQIIEAITVPQDEPDACYCIRLHLPSLVARSLQGQFGGVWERVSRDNTPFPRPFDHGTLIILRDFRAANPDAPFDETKCRVTAQEVTLERIRKALAPPKFAADLLMKVELEGKRIQAPRVEGFPLWSLWPPKRIAGLGEVCGELVLSEDPEQRWCTIGGTTATLWLRTFLDDVREHAPALGRQLPIVLWDKRLAGYLRYGVLESFPTQDREHLLATFYENDACAAIVEHLASVIAPEIVAKLAQFEARPATELTQQSLERVIGRLHHAQGIAPGTVAGGTGTPGNDVLDPSTERLAVNRVTIHLEQLRDGGVPDEAMFRITNALPGETFTWDDRGDGIVAERSATGDSCTVRATAALGTFLVDAQSVQHPQRNRSLTVVVYEARKQTGKEFLLRPTHCDMLVDDTKRVGVRSEGATSGAYVWSGHRKRGKESRPVTCFTVLSGGRSVMFTPTQPGDYIVVCTDQSNPSQTATCEIEVRAAASVATGGAGGEPLPSHGASGDGDRGLGGSYQRKSDVGQMTWTWDGVTFNVVGTHFWDEAWRLDARDRTIWVSDAHPSNIHARTGDARDHFIVWCLASAHAAYRAQLGEITAGDSTAWSSKQNDVLRAFAKGLQLE